MTIDPAEDAVRAALLAGTIAQLERAQGERPWILGLTSIALARELHVAEPLLVRVLAECVESGRLARHWGYYATLDHRPALSQAQRDFFERLISEDDARPLLPIPFAGVASAVKRSEIEGIGQALDTLLARGLLVRVRDDLYRGSQIATIRSRVERYLRDHEGMTAAAFRDLLGTSRKYAVPLLEWFDANGITVRNGDVRLLRAGPASEAP